MFSISDINDPQIKRLTDFYTTNLKGSNAVIHSVDYARLAHTFISICSKIDVTGKAPLKKSNMEVAKQFGFASFDSLLDYLMSEINKSELHGFRINNRRKFKEKLNSFFALKPPSSEALLSLIPKKYGKTNNVRWTNEHQNLLNLLIQNHTGKLRDLAKELNTQFEMRLLETVSYETIKNKARKLLI